LVLISLLNLFYKRQYRCILLCLRIFSFLSLLIWVVSLSGLGQTLNRYIIVPRPAQLTPPAGEFVVSCAITILVPVAQPGLKAIANLFASQLNLNSGLSLEYMPCYGQ